MILTDRDVKTIIIQCTCGCAGLKFQKITDTDLIEDDEYFISVVLDAFYTEQHGFIYKLINRLKTVWQILIKGTHTYQEIILTNSEMQELKDIIKNY